MKEDFDQNAPRRARTTRNAAGQPTRIFLLALTVALTAASCIDPPDFALEGGALWLQHLGTLLLLLPLAADLKLRRFSTPVCICLILFTALHILGARYLYSNVPYHEWAARLLHRRIEMDEIHGNNFDRLVHLAFGLLLLPLFFEIAERWLKIDSFPLALLFAWLFVQCGSMLYEIFEWSLAVFMSPADAEGYNGQQGDMWDAQKDMFLALVGSTATAALLALIRRFARAGERGET